MLQGNGLKPAAVQIFGRTHIIVWPTVVDLQADCGRIIVTLAVIGHRNDDGFQISARGRNGALQVGGKGRDATAAGKRVSDERDAIYDYHVGVSGCLRPACSMEIGSTGAHEGACRTRLAPVALRSLSASGFTLGPG